jgi:glycosyltransferase involved in cell wall biosynthesis
MRILHIIATLDPAAGGPTESVRVLMTYKSIGYKGEAVTLDDPDSPFLKELPFKVHALGRGFSGYRYNPTLIPWLRANAQRYDGIVVNGLWTFCGLAAWRAFAGVKPYVVFSHGMLDPYFKRAFPRKHLKKWLYWLPVEYWVLRNAFRVLFTTQEESRLAEQSFWLHRWNGYVVPYGASRPLGLPPEQQRELFLERFPHLRDRRFLLFLGRIHHKKGCDMLIDAFCKLAHTDPDLDLVMAGPDQEGWVAELQKVVARAGLTHRVHWPGMLKDDYKWGSFFASEAFILPSHQENFGIAVAEALACSIPVLLSDQVNIAPEIAGDNAGLMEHDTPQGTENLLSRWIAMTPDERQHMGVLALDCFDRRFDMQRNAEAIIRLFEIAGARAPVEVAQ